MAQPLFFELEHPFAWTEAKDRSVILENVEDPVWHRFLTEADSYFATRGELPRPRFPVYCHDGDLDEVMAVAVLAYVRGETRLWLWIADWLRVLIDYFSAVNSSWQENRIRVLAGKVDSKGNPGQSFEGFTAGGMYWVEAGLMSTVLHLFDLLETEAPTALSATDKLRLCEALSDFGNRYAFHEEALKYSNRGLWANAGLMIAGLTHNDPLTSHLLMRRAEARNEEYRSTFYDDGMHGEGAPDYHLMSADGLLCYAGTMSRISKEKDLFCAGPFSKDNLFGGYPSFYEIVRAYLQTVIPGATPWNNHRGCSVSIPVPLRPSLIYAYQQTRDPELGWLIKQRMGAIDHDIPTPLQVTVSPLLGLGHYEPLLNFWLYRPVHESHPPRACYNVLPDHGAVISRSGWDSKASSVAARFGYEGTGKGHRDHAHLTLTVAGDEILSDPFPRFGPRGLETSIFHNTITLNNQEPAPVIGSLHSGRSLQGTDTFLINNFGGTLPARAYLHDPRDETNYWFTNHPQAAEFTFQRAVLHVHGKFLAIVDHVAADPGTSWIDWFFHSPLQPEGYSSEGSCHSELYHLQQRTVVSQPETLEVKLRGSETRAEVMQWFPIKLNGHSRSATISLMPLDVPVTISQGHHSMRIPPSTHTTALWDVTDYFLRVRARSHKARVVSMIRWDSAASNVEVIDSPEGIVINLDGFEWEIHFDKSQLHLRKSASPTSSPP